MSKLTITVVENESDLWLIEEPPEPVITITYDHGERAWIVSGDENADHKDFEEQWFPGSDRDDITKDTAYDYTKKWARAVRGVWEVL